MEAITLSMLAMRMATSVLTSSGIREMTSARHRRLEVDHDDRHGLRVFVLDQLKNVVRAQGLERLEPMQLLALGGPPATPGGSCGSATPPDLAFWAMRVNSRATWSTTSGAVSRSGSNAAGPPPAPRRSAG